MKAAEKPSLSERLKERGKAAVRWAKSFFVSEDGPTTGDPTEVAEEKAKENLTPSEDAFAKAERIQAAKAETIETVADMAEKAKRGSETALEIGAGDAGDVTAAVTGTTVSGERLTTKQRVLAGVLAVLPVLAATHIKAVEKLADAADGVPVRTTADNAAELSRNLSREGRAVSQGEAAAHIVASTGTKGHWAASARSRELLERYGIDINDAANGIPRGHPRPHSTMHTRAFHDDVEARLNGVVEKMQAAGYGHKATRAALRRELRTIGKELQAAAK